MRPIIGITSRYLNDKKHYNLPDAYTKAVQRNGGTPIILPPLYDIDQDQLLDLVDGIIFTGGPDGVSEVLEVDSLYYRLCVQWHPELMYKGEMNKLFSVFVEASK